MKTIYKSLLSVSAAAVVAASTLTPAIVNAWGDSANGRPSYTIAEINAGKLGDTITFDSISDGAIGDEKNFVGAKRSSDTGTVWNANEINVQDGEVYTIRIYVHNNSPKGMDAIAENVKTTFSLPTTVAKSHTIIGYIDSSNATPNRYWDEVTLKSNDNFYIEYVKGSAKYTNREMGAVTLPDEVIHSGALVGYTQLDGKIPGCYQYDGEATIQVKVHTSVSTKLTKQVRIKGTKEWGEVVEAKVGDEVEYRIDYQNLLADTAKNVTIRDILPTNVEYVAGTTMLYNSNHKNGVKLSDDITTTGVNIGDYDNLGNATLVFTGKVVDKTMACGKNQLVNWANTTISGAVTAKDDASVMVTKTCEDTPDTPEDTPEVTITTDNPAGTPGTIVNTGPGTIVTGAVGAGSVVTMLGYYIASRKKLM